MTTATVNLGEIAAFWRTARRLYTIYSELNRTFEIGLPLCTELEYPADRSEPELIGRVQQWLEQMDSRLQTWQLRQLLQSTNLQTEENLRALICRHLEKKNKTEIDHDKIDFLLVQYFAHCAPQGPYEQAIKLKDVGSVLEPILGTAPDKFPDWSARLDEKLDTLNQCNSLEELQKSNALVDVRELKQSLAEHYLDVPALVAFTRFNFLARRAFFRAMHLDLQAIRIALNELDVRGVTSVDCKEAGLTDQESLEHIRHVVHQWKTPFRAPYSGGNSFNQLVVLRHILERAVETPPEVVKPAPQVDQEPTAKASAAPAEATPAEPALAELKPAEPQPAPQDEPVPAASVTEAPARAGTESQASPLTTSHSDSSGHFEQDAYLEQCIGDLTRQLLAVPPKRGASVTPITLAGCKLLIATWEAEAFTKGTDEIATVLQRAVAARTILYVCVERQKKQEPTDLYVALEIAHLAAEEMRQQVEKARLARNIDAAVSLAATNKRLLGLIAEGDQLSK
ncbi:MAG TPA: hypothetical protein VI636_06695 [Candidatus Angelobacter sp.]